MSYTASKLFNAVVAFYLSHGISSLLIGRGIYFSRAKHGGCLSLFFLKLFDIIFKTASI
jgi:hypothetical protein